MLTDSRLHYVLVMLPPVFSPVQLWTFISKQLQMWLQLRVMAACHASSYETLSKVMHTSTERLSYSHYALRRERQQ